MGALAKSIALFLLNWLDGQLTLFWVHTNIAVEGNGLMAQLLRLGDAPFMLTKVAIGTFAAYVLYRCSHLSIARHGMELVLGVYVLLMFAHVATGLSAVGWSKPLAMMAHAGNLPLSLLTLLS